MNTLTKAEEQVMHAIWQIEKGFAQDIWQALPEPKPAYNTALTIVRILEKKGFVDYEIFGKSHRYFPKVSKEEYSENLLGDVAKNYFNNSFKSIVSFFVDNQSITLKDLKEIEQIIKSNSSEKE
ncbi:MAG: BlaI/MecI/CopY family transcriptional regulator [Prevotellaceae bacterium]|jgi:predicted transcriptional regulator|nr:BlaI/MecI/CopY family transcriptional regulator [Prevotellaceae bacterium]